MDEEKDNNLEEEQFPNLSNKDKNKIEDHFSKKSKKKAKIIKLIAKHPWVFLAIISAIVIFILVIGFLYVIDAKLFDEGSKAKKSAVALSIDGKTGVTDTTKIVVSKTSDNGYSISNTYTSDELEEIRQEIEKTGVDTTEFTDFEMGVIGGLVENELDVNDYTIKELKCLPKFLKAEAATKYLDLRSNEDKFKDGQYKPQQLSDLGEEEVPGVILVQRTNTKDNNPVILEYKEESDFNSLNDEEKLNYFTIDENENLVIAKWGKTTVVVNGEFPENLSEEEKIKPSEQYSIILERIPYNQLIQKYTMPFEFLLQLLIITEDPAFCTEVADIVLGSKIIINLQEEETITVTTDKRNYDIYNKEEKYLDYEVTPNIEKETNYFLKLVKDDEGNDCTTYNKEQKNVTITTTNVSHSYVFEVQEADTWIAHYIKNYVKQDVVGPTKGEAQTVTDEDVAEEGAKYEKVKDSQIVDAGEIQKDASVKAFKKEKEDNYRKEVATPSIKVTPIGNQSGNEFSNSNTTVTTDLTNYQVDVTPMNQIEYTSLPNRGTSYIFNSNNLPTYIDVVTKPYGINFRFARNINNYTLASNSKNNIINCNTTKLQIAEYNKIKFKYEVSTETTIYPTDPHPTTNTHIYAKDDSGNLEKFLLVYDNNKKAVEMIRDVDSWLFEMMENDETTINLLDIIKYLLYVYDGTDYGVTELDASLFEGSEFINFGNGTGWWWPIGSSATESINGVTYAKGDPVNTKITSGVGPRWGKNHGGIDIAGPRYTNIIAAKSGTVIKVMDGFGDGWHRSVNDFCKDGGGYGNHIKIQHDDGTCTIYGHLQKGTIKVSQGDYVEQGQLIAQMGTSGDSTGVHLHFEIRDADNNKLDPEEFVDPKNPRPVSSSSTLKDWIWNIEGGSQYIKGNVWTVFDPAGSGDNTMNLAHGMVIADYNGADSWYPEIIPGKITVGQTVTEEQANKIWEIKIKGFCDAINSSCTKYGVTLKSYQIDALVSYIYRTGYGNGQNNKLVEAYKNGGNSGLWNYMKNGYNRKYIVGTKARIAEEYELFVKGDYNYNPNRTVKYDQYCNNPNI